MGVRLVPHSWWQRTRDGDHQEWCLGDAQLNPRSMAEAEAVAREGELTHEALVAAGEQYRLAQEGANPHG
jgi:hypothetical protein